MRGGEAGACGREGETGDVTGAPILAARPGGPHVIGLATSDEGRAPPEAARGHGIVPRAWALPTIATMTDTDPTAAPTDPFSPEHLDRRARTGRAIRDLGHAVIGHHAADDLLDEITATLESLTSRLAAGAPRHRESNSFQSNSADWAATPEQEVPTGFDDRPVCGRSSPWGLDPVIRRVGDEIHATVTLRSAHEGAPGRSHGGVVSALFDDIFGFVLSIQRTPAFTGELSLRYVAGTPLGVPLVCKVWLDRIEGRKLFMDGELVMPDGAVCVRARATFISIDTSKVPGWGDGV